MGVLALVLVAATLSSVAGGGPGHDASTGVPQLDRAWLVALHAQAAAMGGAAFVRYYMRG